MSEFTDEELKILAGRGYFVFEVYPARRADLYTYGDTIVRAGDGLAIVENIEDYITKYPEAQVSLDRGGSWVPVTLNDLAKIKNYYTEIFGPDGEDVWD